MPVEMPLMAGRASTVPAISTAPIGTLTNSTHRQLSRSVRMPPTTAPNAPPVAPIAAQTPSARARAFGSV